MKKIIDKFRLLVYFPLWVIVLLGFFGLGLIKYILIMIKKRKIVKKIIYSNLVQNWKEKVTSHPKIIIK